jgi:hypothetical protein
MAKKHKILRTEDDISPLNRKLINTVCHKCNFYAEDQEYWEREYECGAYKLIRQMLEENKLTFEEIEDFFTRADLNPERELR